MYQRQMRRNRESWLPVMDGFENSHEVWGAADRSCYRFDLSRNPPP